MVNINFVSGTMMLELHSINSKPKPTVEAQVIEQIKQLHLQHVSPREISQRTSRALEFVEKVIRQLSAKAVPCHLPTKKHKFLRLSAEEKVKIEKLVADGYNFNEIADRLQRKNTTVINYAKRAGIFPESRLRKLLSAEEKDQILDLYLNQGQSLLAIAAQLKRNKMTIKKYLRKLECYAPQRGARGQDHHA